MEGGSSSSKKKKLSDAGNVKEKVVNIDLLEQSLWLVKVPQFVAHKWSTAQHDEMVGSLSITSKAGGFGKKPTKQLNIDLEPSGDHLSNGPTQFTLEEINPTGSSSDSFIAFSNDSDGLFSIDGKVTKNLTLRPKASTEYLQLVRERGLTKITSRREATVADAAEVERAAMQSHTVPFITSDRMEFKRKAAAEKAFAASKRLASAIGSGMAIPAAAELDIEALKSKMFEAFEQKDRLVFKDLIAFCSDVEGFTKERDLRDLLDEYAVYHRRGPYKQFWELKPEYRSYVQKEDNADENN